MNLVKVFFRPNKWKLIIFLIVLFLTAIGFISPYFYANDFLFYILFPISYPVSYLTFGAETGYDQFFGFPGQSSGPLTGSLYIILLIIGVAYYYFISCLLYLIIKKIIQTVAK